MAFSAYDEQYAGYAQILAKPPKYNPPPRWTYVIPPHGNVSIINAA